MMFENWGQDVSLPNGDWVLVYENDDFRAKIVGLSFQLSSNRAVVRFSVNGLSSELDLEEVVLGYGDALSSLGILSGGPLQNRFSFTFPLPIVVDPLFRVEIKGIGSNRLLVRGLTQVYR